MKILFTVSNSSLMDGINRHVLSVTKALSALPDLEVAVCTVRPEGDLNQALTRAGVRNYALGARNGHDIRGAVSFFRVLREFNPDIVHIHVLGFLQRLVLKCFFKKIKCVMTIHGISYVHTNPTWRSRLVSILSRPFAFSLAGQLFISKGVCDALVKYGHSKCFTEVIYNPFDFSRQTSCEKGKLRQLLGLSDDISLVGTACRIAAVKNPSSFSRVICEVLRDNSLAHAVIIGDGVPNLMQEILTIVKEKGLNGRVHLLGYRADAPELIRDLNCFILTSKCEGLPTSLLECMSQRVPFAFMNGAGGLVDLAELNVKEGPFAVCVEQGDEVGLVRAVCEILQDPEAAQMRAKRAFDVGERIFNVQSIAQQMKAFYQRALR